MTTLARGRYALLSFDPQLSRRQKLAEAQEVVRPEAVSALIGAPTPKRRAVIPESATPTCARRGARTAAESTDSIFTRRIRQSALRRFKRASSQLRKAAA